MGGDQGIEPWTSSSQRKNHTPRPIARYEGFVRDALKYDLSLLQVQIDEEGLLGWRS